MTFFKRIHNQLHVSAMLCKQTVPRSLFIQVYTACGYHKWPKHVDDFGFVTNMCWTVNYRSLYTGSQFLNFFFFRTVTNNIRNKFSGKYKGIQTEFRSLRIPHRTYEAPPTAHKKVVRYTEQRDSGGQTEEWNKNQWLDKYIKTWCNTSKWSLNFCKLLVETSSVKTSDITSLWGCTVAWQQNKQNNYYQCHLESNNKTLKSIILSIANCRKIVLCNSQTDHLEWRQTLGDYISRLVLHWDVITAIIWR